MFPIFKLTKVVPIEFGIAGRKRKLLLDLFDKVIPIKGIVDAPGGIKIDSSSRNEKVLFCFFFNVMRYYVNSPLFKYMKDNLGKGDIFLDIGAYLGFYSYLAKEMGCNVWLFEPQPSHVEFLKRNVHIFDMVFDIALSGNEGESEFYVAKDDNLGGSSLVKSNRGWEDSGYSHTVNVKTQRLDNIITDAQIISKIKLAKIDVEGAEQSVVEGMEGLLKRNRIDIWCEVRGEQSDRNPGSYKEVCDFLKTLGYRSYVYDGQTLHEFSTRHITQVFDMLFVCS